MCAIKNHLPDCFGNHKDLSTFYLKHISAISSHFYRWSMINGDQFYRDRDRSVVRKKQTDDRPLGDTIRVYQFTLDPWTNRIRRSFSRKEKNINVERKIFSRPDQSESFQRFFKLTIMYLYLCNLLVLNQRIPKINRSHSGAIQGWKSVIKM